MSARVEDAVPAPRWERILAWGIRASVLAMAVYHAAIGDPLLTAYCALALAVLLVPPLLARTSAANLPVEIEIALLVLLSMGMILGRWLGLYDRIVYFDKVLHLGDSVLLGFLGFLLLFVLRTTDRLRVSAPIAVGLTVWLTLGLGAAWEIGEYATDRIFGAQTQGSPNMPPLDDTMWDLILDACGGLAGGVVGVAYLKRSRRARRVGRWFERPNA